MSKRGERVKVVTDSTAYLPPGAAERLDIHVVPLRVQLGERTATDGVDVTGDQVAAALRDKIRVTTSRPSPAEFAAMYQARLDAGADRVVSVHLAAALSGTWESAALAAQDFPHGVVRVVDSRSTAGALGFAVLAAAERAAEGASAAAVQGAATDVVDHTRTLFYVDSLEYLRRGGRVGTAAALFATSLSFKPLLQMVEGSIVPLEKVRTSSKAVARLVQLTIDAAGDAEVDVAVHHVAARARAEQVAAQLRDAIAHLRALHVAELGPVVAAHLGPGVIGTVVVRR
ncbi:MAG: fatty acid kinase fatty acid binding subunit [Pseudonocardiales bacterium]|jgi:DegV family protein with EDD domain|nr:fatty acid kinase fatty acid binding subunit [Pseudonocardiales bacterium]